MLRYLAVLGLFTASFVTAAETPLLVQAEASITCKDGLSTAQCKFSSKSGRTLNFTVGDAAETKFEFTVNAKETRVATWCCRGPRCKRFPAMKPRLKLAMPRSGWNSAC